MTSPTHLFADALVDYRDTGPHHDDRLDEPNVDCVEFMATMVSPYGLSCVQDFMEDRNGPQDFIEKHAPQMLDGFGISPLHSERASLGSFLDHILSWSGPPISLPLNPHVLAGYMHPNELWALERRKEVEESERNVAKSRRYRERLRERREIARRRPSSFSMDYDSCSVSDLERLEDRGIFLEAQRSFRSVAIKMLDGQLKAARTGKPFELQRLVSLIAPQDHTDDYDRSIQMLEMSVDKEIDVDEREFQNYVQDVWNWSRDWAISNLGYVSKKTRGYDKLASLSSSND